MSKYSPRPSFSNVVNISGKNLPEVIGLMATDEHGYEDCNSSSECVPSLSF